MTENEVFDAILKMADEMETNEDATNKGVMQVHLDPPDRQPGTLDAKWGDKPVLDSDGYQAIHGIGVKTESSEDRAGVLARLFDGFGEAAQVAKASLNQNFVPGIERRPPHAALLQKTAATEIPEHETLASRIRNASGRF